MHHEHTEFGWRVIVRTNRRCELTLAHGPIQPRCPARTENHRQEVQCWRIDMQRARRTPPHRELRLPDVASELAVPEAAPLLRWPGRTRGRSAGKTPVEALDFAHRLVRI